MGSRFLAYFIDAILIGVVGSILAGMGIGGSAGTYIGSIAAGLVYYLAFAYFNEGITVGKMALKMVVKTDNGGDVDQKTIMVRELLKVVLMPIAFISFIICLVNEDKKSIHDMIVDTVVLKK